MRACAGESTKTTQQRLENSDQHRVIRKSSNRITTEKIRLGPALTNFRTDTSLLSLVGGDVRPPWEVFATTKRYAAKGIITYRHATPMTLAASTLIRIPAPYLSERQA